MLHESHQQQMRLNQILIENQIEKESAWNAMIVFICWCVLTTTHLHLLNQLFQCHQPADRSLKYVVIKCVDLMLETKTQILISMDDV